VSGAELVERQAALFAAVAFVCSLAAFATRRHLVGFACALGAAAVAAILFAAARPESGRIGAATAILFGAGALATAALGLVARWHADSGSAAAGSLRPENDNA
jgi:hypothetical protein